MQLSGRPPNGTTRPLDVQEAPGPPEAGIWPFAGTQQSPGDPQQTQSSHPSHQFHRTFADPRGKQGRRGVDDAEHWGETAGTQTAEDRDIDHIVIIAREPPSAKAGRQLETVAEEKKGG